MSEPPVNPPVQQVSPAGRPEIYLAGLRLAGRRVVVVGGGAVALRRVRGLLAAAADVVLVAPDVVAPLRELAEAGRLTWLPRGYLAGDLGAAWYAVAATDDPQTNAAVGAEAEAGRVFCVRADRFREGSALTPASGRAAGLRIGVLSDGAVDADPRRVAATRDAIVAAVEDGRLAAPEARPAG